MTYQPLKIPEFSFDSPLTDLVIRLDHLRTKEVGGTTPIPIFLDLKRLFHILESVQSARIEGNRTTFAEAIDVKLAHQDNRDETEDMREIANIESALQFIDEHIIDNHIDRGFISHLHNMVVNGLQREGSGTPGVYRHHNVAINKSVHRPPEFLHVTDLMEELLTFIQQPNDKKFDLLKIAIAHHRFAWIHPYDNGNGRMARLLTYAMLIKHGFDVRKSQRILNPTGLFCVNREAYYEKLSLADDGSSAGLVTWCVYVLKGLVDEITKIDKLADYEYLSKEILVPAIKYGQAIKSISDEDAKILIRSAQFGKIVARDVRIDFPDYYPVKISRLISRLKAEHLIKPYPKSNSNSYVLSLSKSKMLRYVARQLIEKGFIVTEQKESM